MKNLSILITVLILAAACSQQAPKEAENPQAVNEKLVTPPASWIKDRVSKAESRLSATEAGQKIWASIEAHGGLSKWFANGPISFHFDYKPIEGGRRRNSYQVVDQWSSRAVHEVADNRGLKYGWDGSDAWTYPDTADVGVNPRFWSTTPFYFIGLPFVLADDGVMLTELEPLEFDGVTYDLVKATYESGTGDAPDDYYVVYIHPETKRMGGLRYIVSYPGFFPDGGHSPEKFMEILDHQTIEGVTIPTGYKTYWFKENTVGEHVTDIDVTEVSFMPDLEKGFFDMPAGAKVQEGM